jgi:hypothetical protein
MDWTYCTRSFVITGIRGYYETLVIACVRSLKGEPVIGSGRGKRLKGRSSGPSSSVVRHDDKSSITVIETETDGFTGFESDGGEPVVGDLKPREIRLSVWLRGPRIWDCTITRRGFTRRRWGRFPQTDPAGTRMTWTCTRMWATTRSTSMIRWG